MALIISIIVIFILAGVSVKSLLDEGTMDKSKKSLNDAETKITKTQENINDLKKDWEEIEGKIDKLIDPSVPPDSSDTKEGDGIPDKYQIVVNYAAVNGTVSFSETVVTKYDEAGNPSENGTATLSAAHIPAITANAGYRNGTWDKVPTVGLEIKSNTTFTIIYK